MEYTIESTTDRELVLRNDENQLIKLTLIRPGEHYGLHDTTVNDDEYDIVVYSELRNEKWVNHPAVCAKDVMNVHDKVIKIEDLTFDFSLRSIFNNWYRCLNERRG